ncbi:MAG: cysteine desulfurase family protein [Dehalococcoidia bacterium]
MKELLYLDHAATTPVDPRVVEAMLPYFTDAFGNPSGIYSLSQKSQKALEDARDSVAGLLSCKPNEVIFTGGASESDNAAIKGGALALRQSGNHIVTTSVEHHAVLHACESMEGLGFETTYLPVDKYGLVSTDDLLEATTNRTVLVSIILANNEVGTIQPIQEMARAVKEKARSLGRNVILHTDATQAGGVLDLNVNDLGVDMLTLGAHKFYGPKGVGILYLRKGTPFMPQQHGGSQERNRRAGTENIPLIVGCATALKIAIEQQDSYNEHCTRLRDRLIEGVLGRVGKSYLNGHPTQRLPNNANFCFDGVEGESILLGLDMEGIAASSGSACTSGSLEPSHVLSAMGVSAERAVGSLRLTVGRGNDDEDIDKVLDVLPGIIERLRAVSGVAQTVT